MKTLTVRVIQSKATSILTKTMYPIVVNLKSGAALDVLIMGEGGYQIWLWLEMVEPDTYYKHYEDRDRLHAFFTAPQMTNT